MIENEHKMNENVGVLGTFFGDEGKGHITHALSPEYDYVIRFNGGGNAGHTIYRDGKKFVHHLLPSIDFRTKHIKGFLGAGMVIDLEQLHDELTLAEQDYPGVSTRIYVDPDAFVILPQHKEEDKTKNGDLGTTNKGIGPCYAEKIARRGTRIHDLIQSNSNIICTLTEMGVNFVHALELRHKLAASKLLFEGAQGVMLDINHGTYPYVSSSDCTIAGIAASGFGFVMPRKVYGVAKAYSTRVGAGPFPTELEGKAAESLREQGKEYGSTTGRPRRVGWLDLPALKYAVEKSGITSLIITKLDILNGMNKVPVCFSYDKTPVCGNDFANAKTKLLEVKGWTNPKDYAQIREFIHNIEYFSETRVSLISCGTDKKDILGL